MLLKDGECVLCCLDALVQVEAALCLNRQVYLKKRGLLSKLGAEYVVFLRADLVLHSQVHVQLHDWYRAIDELVAHYPLHLLELLVEDFQHYQVEIVMSVQH